MAVSTSERRRKADGREYDTPPSLPCTPKELYVLLDKWIADGVFKPNQVSREPTEEERRDPRFFRLHNCVQRPTPECWAFRRLVHCKIKEGTLELTQPEVQRNSLPNHKGKLRFTAKERTISIEALVSIASRAGIEFLTAEVVGDRALLQESSEITFSDEDMEVGYSDHKRPLYLAASINQIPIRRVLANTRALP
ncbi:hypothetical protein SO802_021365 [Lithocarpus litseifolius]|uniref:Uncharacterized protein n=1 Tax=Lithocarpus litseifolius TaxID=425828 RepID=A0AAW2CIZ7_9ROSI